MASASAGDSGKDDAGLRAGATSILASRTIPTHRPAEESPMTTRDYVELDEDVSHSPLWNPDLAPTP
ncbi:MAG: hypothetical protein ACXW2P_11600, partial [Thermoanaerobaculia bacterium]